LTYTRRVVRNLNVAGNALPFALGAVTVGVLAADQGGYFATSWGWAALGLLIVAAVTVSLGPTSVVTRPTLVMLGGLAALVLWSALSITWSTPTAAMPEVERTALYLVAALAVSLLAGRGSLAPLVGGVLTAITLIAVYSLATRLLPDRLGVFDPVATYRLSEPVGYWNALGLLAALGALLAIGLAARAESVAASVLAAATLPVLASTIYFTFSRGSWAALFVGLLVGTAFDRRFTAFATVVLTLSIPAAIAVLLASKSRALTTEGQSLSQAAHDGHRLIPFVILLTVVSAALGWAVRPIRGFALPRIVRRALLAAVLGAVVALLVALALRPYAPGSEAHRLYAQFNGANPATPNGDLTSRLFSLSSNGRVDQHAASAWCSCITASRRRPSTSTSRRSSPLRRRRAKSSTCSAAEPPRDSFPSSARSPVRRRTHRSGGRRS